jgi:hypothetical protein
MNTGYQMYQAERTMSTAEQRAADRGAAELVRLLGGLWRSATAPFRRARQPRQPQGSRPAR